MGAGEKTYFYQKRPGLERFLAKCRVIFEVILWTAGPAKVQSHSFENVQNYQAHIAMNAVCKRSIENA